MKRIYISLFLALICVFLLLGCTSLSSIIGVRGSGDVIEEERDVSDFKQVKLSGMGNLDIEFDDQEELVIEAEDNLMEYIITEVKGDELIIRIKPNTRLWPKKKIKFHLKAIELEKISIFGSGKVDATDISADRFTIDIYGSGKVNIDELEAEDLEIEVSGSGNVAIDGGEVTEQRMKVSGSGNYKAQDLKSEDAEIDVSGSGKAIINVRDNLEVNISGSGKVQYKGDPEVDSNISGSGSVKKINE